MAGDERVRTCSRCQRKVYNVPELTEGELERLVAEHEGERLCVRMLFRRDGTALTRDCPVGYRRSMLRWGALIAGALLLAGIVLSWLFPPEPPFLGTRF